MDMFNTTESFTVGILIKIKQRVNKLPYCALSTKRSVETEIDATYLRVAI